MPTNPTPTPPPERADLEALEGIAQAEDDEGYAESADMIRAAAAELERLRKQVHSDDMEARSALGWAGEFDMTNTVAPQRSVVELGLALRERNADLARLRAENNRLRAENKNARERLVEQECQLDDLRLTLAEPEETVVVRVYFEQYEDGSIAGVRVLPDHDQSPYSLDIRIPRAPVDALFATREVRGEVER